MVRAGWLLRLAKGVYLLTGDTPSRDGILSYLAGQVPGLHVGSKTALAWRGIRHNVAFSERVELWGSKPYRFGSWVGQHMPFSYQTTHLFDDNLPPAQGLKPLPNGRRNILVSIPERALLELASDVGKGQSVEEARNLVALMRNLRTSVLDEFLAHCHRVKVVRLVRDLGHAENMPWASEIQKHVDRLGADKRWSGRTRDGGWLTLKPR
jgi:hypothetical protein